MLKVALHRMYGTHEQRTISSPRTNVSIDQKRSDEMTLKRHEFSFLELILAGFE